MKINKVTIIAEAGVNHNGDIRLAKKLVDVAKNSGADYIKFQAFFAKELVTLKSKLAKYQQKNLREKLRQFDLLKKLELKKNDYVNIINYCKKKVNYLEIIDNNNNYNNNNLEINDNNNNYDNNNYDDEKIVTL